MPREVARQLPPAPDRLTRAGPVPHLDTQCRFPWYGVAGCKGKDTRAMLRLTVSDAIESRSRLEQVPAWYEAVRVGYGAK